MSEQSELSEVNSCKTCKHWKPLNDEGSDNYMLLYPLDMGICKNVPCWDDSGDWDDYCNYIPKPEHAHLLAFTSGDMTPSLLTKAMFGCVNHTSKGERQNERAE